MTIRLPRLLFTEIIATSISSNTNPIKSHCQQQQQQQHSSISHVEQYLTASPIDRARHLGTRIRLGSLLWHSPSFSPSQPSNNDNNNDNTVCIEETKMKKQIVDGLSNEMINALKQNWVGIEKYEIIVFITKFIISYLINPIHNLVILFIPSIVNQFNSFPPSTIFIFIIIIVISTTTTTTTTYSRRHFLAWNFWKIIGKGITRRRW